MSLDESDGWRSEPSSVESAVGRMETTDESSPAGNIFLFFWEFGFLLNLERETESILTESLLVLIILALVLIGMDDLHLTSLLVVGWVEFVSDDGGVWDLVVGDEVDGSRWRSSRQMSGGDGQLKLSLWSLTGNSREWNFNNDVTLNSSLVFLSSEGNFEGKLTVDFPGIAK